MKEAAEFFDKFKTGLIGGLNTCAICEIVAFDAAAMKADIEILPDRSLVKSVPVATIRSGAFFMRVPYAAGDHVLVVFAQRDIDGTLHGEEGSTGRMLDLNDAIVIGGITLFTEPLPGANAGDLVIATESMGASFILTPAQEVKIVGSGGVTITGKNSTGSW